MEIKGHTEHSQCSSICLDATSLDLISITISINYRLLSILIKCVTKFRHIIFPVHQSTKSNTHGSFIMSSNFSSSVYALREATS